MKKAHLGDRGETSLVGGRVPKDDPRVESYGTIDEMNSALGLMRSFSEFDDMSSHIKRIQNDLFSVGAELATVTEKGSSYRISRGDVEWLEKISAEMEAEIRPLNKFVLPGGSRLSSAAHLARSICRRAERRLVSLSRKEGINPELIRYVNRLSDVLFVMSRLANQRLGVDETTWGPDDILGI